MSDPVDFADPFPEEVDPQVREVLVGNTPDTLDEMLEYFCAPSTDEWRVELQRPVSDGMLVWATTGSVGVELPAHLLHEEYEPNGAFPDLSAVIQTVQGGAPLGPFPRKSVQSALKQMPLKKVRQRLKCQRCKGHGGWMCPACGQPEECGECDGRGWASGEVKGWTYSSDGAVRVGKGHFDPRFLWMLAELARLMESDQIPAYEDRDQRGYPRVVFEAGEAWMVMIAKRLSQPQSMTIRQVAP